MFFEYPELLWLLAVPVLLVLHYIYIELAGRRPHLRVSSIGPWKAGGNSVYGVIRHIPMVLRTIALVMMVIVLICMAVMNRFGEGEEEAMLL